MAEYTSEQRAAVESGGKVIVSASAGSGKTFVMIEKLTRAVLNGADLDSVLAVTFTKKAAAQMKEKLRASLIARIDGLGGPAKARLKGQIAKISSADISTIHSFCSRLLRTYFYLVGLDGGFEIISDDDPSAPELKNRALDDLFEELYEREDGEFYHLLKCFSRKRSDASLRRLVLESYSAARNLADYREMLASAGKLYTDEGFSQISEETEGFMRRRLALLKERLSAFEASFPTTKNAAAYNAMFSEMHAALEKAEEEGLFGTEIRPVVTKKPRDPEEDKPAGEAFKAFKTEFCEEFSALREGLESREAERRKFIGSGRTAVAFCNLLLAFDGQYTAVKREENKLDYADLEHLVLELLKDPAARREIASKYRYVFVDEYQDVNPVQERILSEIGSEVFLVGDVKQAIYGFRGSKSLFFAEKYRRFEGGDGTAMKLTGNFRSAPAVIDFVNALFSQAMNSDVCGFDYKGGSEMTACAPYPEDCGGAQIVLFEEDGQKAAPTGVYSVAADSRPLRYTGEGLAVLKIVENVLKSKHYDLKEKRYVDTQAGDICILTRKNKGSEGIIRALTDAGYTVSGGQEGNICELPEVKRVIDILSFLDNAEQDIPQVTAMLSPLGGFTEDELAEIRIAYKKKIPFRSCCAQYAAYHSDKISQKLNTFAEKCQKLRDLSEILNVGELIDVLLSESGMEAAYSAGGGEKLKNVQKLAAEGPSLTLGAFLARLKAGGFNVKPPAAAPTDSIKVMTMHASKGLEFPVVIVADICRTFKGRDRSEMPFDEKYGFAPKLYDVENGLVSPTILRRLASMRAEREELKNELNLFYVACTRATNKLYVLASEAPEYSPLGALSARDYAHTFDISSFSPVQAEEGEIDLSAENVPFAPCPPDPQISAALEETFMRPYANASGVDLPVKSSASAILKSRRGEEYFAERSLYGGEGETGAARGTAYHRFLELCDFSLTSPGDIAEEIATFTREGKMPPEQSALLDIERILKILSMPVFSGLQGATLYREREFLCRLQASEIFPTDSSDFVLVQGAIDLFADFGGRVRIIDYKYSMKSDEELVKTYSGQLELYKKASSVITGVSPENIQTAIVNIYRCTQILL